MFYRIILLIVIIASLYFLVSWGNIIGIKNNTLEAKVIKVIDGDTIEIEGGDQVRYIGINTPEMGEYFSQEATNKNKQLVEGKQIKVERDVLYKDKYQRILGYVSVGSVMVNEELLQGGYGDILLIEPDLKYKIKLLKALQIAKQKKVGLWKENH